MSNGYFVDNPMGIERSGGGTELPPKKFGKFFREPEDALMQRRVDNDPTLEWHKEIILAWHIDAKKDHKGNLLPTKFEGLEAYNCAISSGEYFSSPNAAMDAKKTKANKKIAALADQLDTNSEEMKATVNKSVGRPKKS